MAYDWGAVSSSSDLIQNLLRKSAVYGPVIALIGIYVVFSIVTDRFLTYRNQLNILRQVSIIGILAIGVTFAILCAEIDLSIAQMTEFTGVLIAALATGMYYSTTVPVPIAVLIGLGAGVSVGAIAGYITSRFDVPSFMSTLAVLFLADGLSLIVSDGRPIGGIPDSLQVIGRESVAGVPLIVLFFLSLLVVSQLILSYTRFGLYIYAVGGDRQAARLMGINVMRIRFAVLVISAAFTVFAAIALIGRIGSANPNMGSGLLLPPIAAVILGGTNLFGGEGNMIGTLVGVLILGSLANGLNLVGVGPSGQLVAQGIILMIAVLMNVFARG
ncbi:ABC transporter permease [Halobacteria archaeon AArc-m2/3/4]|uniref:ABC transporter permease n=1 Tax=Natronoglomus mannanivorans TaxID=2979990 RepID=A0ABT2QIS3_9EURY|nr:ABC transporter permease [Halobacteria archaeon AArc-m2/3/4]